MYPEKLRFKRPNNKQIRLRCKDNGLFYLEQGEIEIKVKVEIKAKAKDKTKVECRS